MKCDASVSPDGWHFKKCGREATWRWRWKSEVLDSEWRYTCARHVRKSDKYYDRERVVEVHK